MILLYYSFLCFLAMFYAFQDKKRIFNYYIVYLALLVWSYIARNFLADQDILVYMSTMQYETSVFFSGWYFLREPIYWLSSHFLYKILQNEMYVFVLIDSIVLSLFVYLSYKLKIKPYFILIFMLFFPNMMGFLNVYRQFLANIFLFISFLYVINSNVKSYFFYTLSFLTHNVAGVFLPLIFLKKCIYQNILFWISCIISLFLMVYFSGSKSVGETGETSPLLFLAVSIFVFIAFMILNKFKITIDNSYFYYMNIYLLFISFVSNILLSNLAAKRISMIALVFIFYSIYWCIERKDRHLKIILRIFFVILAILPTLIFSSAFNMLLVNNN